MEEYIVNTNGSVTVEAKSKEEAEEKAWENIGVGGRHEVLDVEAQQMNSDKDQFQIKVAECGSNKANASYSLIKDQSAMRLAHQVVQNISKDFVGKQQSPHFKFELAALILSGLEGDSMDKDEFWEFRNELREKVHEKGYDEVIGKMWAIVDEDENQETLDQADSSA